jgi:hypothetical protein
MSEWVFGQSEVPGSGMGKGKLCHGETVETVVCAELHFDGGNESDERWSELPPTRFEAVPLM